MANNVLALSALILQLIAACSGCVDPIPPNIAEVKETDGPGTVLLRMPGTSNTSWTFHVQDPSRHATYLKGFLRIATDNGNSLLVVAHTLDLEQIRAERNFELSTFTLELTCTEGSGGTYRRIVVINEISEYSPVFEDPMPVFNVSEEAGVDTLIDELADHVTDLDVQNNGYPSDIQRFYTTPYLGNEMRSGDGIVGVSTSGNLVLLKSLDYENGDTMFAINVTAKDTGGLTDRSVVKIAVLNENDNAPTFSTLSVRGSVENVTEYKATVDPSYTGPILMEPGPIQASDPDNDIISYNFVTGHPEDFRQYLSLDVKTGVVYLSNPVKDANISHFTIIIEARDGPPNQRDDGTSEKSHSTTASLLVFVHGRNIDFPANPRSTTSSSSFNTDALFISVIVLSTLLFVFIIAIIFIACKVRRERRQGAMAHLDKSNTSKERSTSDWSIQMRHIEQDGEKDLIHTLSRSGSNTNQGFSNDTNDEVFVNGIAPYPHSHSHQPTGNDDTRIGTDDGITRGVMPYQANASQTVAMTTSSTLPLRHPSTIISTNFGSQTQMDVNDALESLNILTSVKPIGDDRHQSNSGTLKSMKGRENLNEVGQVILKDGNRYDKENGEKITSFTKDNSHDFRRGSDVPKGSRSTVEGVTVFGKDMDVAVIPFDHNSNIDENAFMFR